MTTPSKPGKQADPAAIDLEAIESRCGPVSSNALKGLPDLRLDCLDLIAAVETLWERVAELQENWDVAFKAGVFHQNRAKAAEAHADELAKALNDIAKGMVPTGEMPSLDDKHEFRYQMWQWSQKRARAALPTQGEADK